MNGTHLRILRLPALAVAAGAGAATGPIACSAPDTQDASEYQRTDSAGIVIVETPGESARVPLGWTVDSVPDLQIGVVSGEPSYQFDRIRGISGDNEGNVRVVDSGSREVRVFDRFGTVLTVMGGPGAGPGEFRSVNLVGSLSQDTITVFDLGARRFTTFAKDGGVLEVSPPLQLPRGTPIPVGAVGLHVLLEDLGVVGMRPNRPPDPGTLRIVDAATGVVGLLGDFPGREYYDFSSGGTSTSDVVPFDIRPSAAAGRETFFVTPGEGPEILEYDTLSRLQRILRLAEPGRPPTQEDLDQLIEERISMNSPEWADYIRDQFHTPALPEIMPAFDDLHVDAEGWLWARIYEPVRDKAEPTTWLVFEPEGKACGTATIPGSLDVHYIGRDFMLGLWRDELNVEYVRRHLLDRSAPC